MSVHLSKQAAAHRLLKSAMKMWERGDDPVAITVVAAAALNVLRETLKRRGESFGTQAMRELLYSAAKERAAGAQRSLSLGQFFEPVIDELAKLIAAGGAEDAQDILLNFDFSPFERVLVSEITTTFNFLKHADRDWDAVLDEDHLKPLQTISVAALAFWFLFPAHAAAEDFTAWLGRNG